MAFSIVLLASIAPVGVSAAVQLPDFTELVEETSPAVVHIQTSNVGRRRNNNSRSEEVPEFFRRFFDTPEMPEGHPFGEERRGGGSGFIVDSGGYIVTNHHVVEGAEKILVRLADRREYEAEVVGSDQQSDIALLKVQAEGLPTLPLGDSDSLKRGQWVIWSKLLPPVLSAARGAAMDNSSTCRSCRRMLRSTAAIQVDRC
jgi:serine protease Do